MSDSRIVHLNGQYLPLSQAQVSIMDRGLLFADAVYEVCAVLDGRLVDFAGHMRRLQRSLTELAMPHTVDETQLLAVHRELVRRNAVDQGLVYMQVTRGVADRDFGFDNKNLTPTVMLFTQARHITGSSAIEHGLKVVSVPESRWGRRDIKTVQLLSAVLAKAEARRRGADDAWFVADGVVNEGSSNNAWIVTADGVLMTPPLSHDILPGITRAAVLRCAQALDLAVCEQHFTIEQVHNAREAFSTSATSFVTPVVAMDGVAIGNGKPGPVARHLLQAYVDEARKQAI